MKTKFDRTTWTEKPASQVKDKGMEGSSGGHTPGPWRASPDMYGNKHAFEIRAGGEFICRVSNLGATSDHKPTATRWRAESPANARLISAAPEMLEAARCALGALTGNLDGDWSLGDPAEMLRAAIRKATGEQP